MLIINFLRNIGKKIILSLLSLPITLTFLIVLYGTSGLLIPSLPLRSYDYIPPEWETYNRIILVLGLTFLVVLNILIWIGKINKKLVLSYLAFIFSLLLVILINLLIDSIFTLFKSKYYILFMQTIYDRIFLNILYILILGFFLTKIWYQKNSK